MSTYRYMKIPIKYLTDEIKVKYQIDNIAQNGWVNVEIRKAMHGLKKLGIIDYKILVKFLAPYGYQLVRHTLDIWTHTSKTIKFSLALNNFVLRYDNKADVEHLCHVLCCKYTISKDWTGHHYCNTLFIGTTKKIM